MCLCEEGKGRDFVPIAHICNAFVTKFGIPRQSGIVDEIISRVEFEPEYRDPNVFRGILGYSHLWLLWEFSEHRKKPWSPTVKPPRLGGNTRVGVFATRSPFRPNPIGLSCVRLLDLIFERENFPVLLVAGADLMDGTPIYDIKPYLAYTDSHPDARGGFTDPDKNKKLKVHFAPELQEKLSGEEKAAVCNLLAIDPRPAYQHDENRIYGMAYAKYDIRFFVRGEELTICEIVLREEKGEV